jgi:telomere length regulation protein
MDGILTAMRTVTRHDQNLLGLTSEHDGAKNLGAASQLQPLDHSSLEYIIGLFKSNPSQEQLEEALLTLDVSNNSLEKAFDIRLPTPATAQILHVLVSITIPDHWGILEEAQGNRKTEQKLKVALLRCLFSVVGVSAVVAQLRTLIATFNSSTQSEGSGKKLIIRDTISFLSILLKPRDTLLRLYTDIFTLYDNSIKKQIAWRELISLFAAGRILSIAAEALALIKDQDHIELPAWIGEGTSYASWLGHNLHNMTSKIDYNDGEAWKSAGLVTGRALSFGYTGDEP